MQVANNPMQRELARRQYQPTPAEQRAERLRTMMPRRHHLRFGIEVAPLPPASLAAWEPIPHLLGEPSRCSKIALAATDVLFYPVTTRLVRRRRSSIRSRIL
jgi:hypothetical protein